VASARNVGAGVVSGTPIKHPVSQWGASTCFAAKMIPGFPGNLAFDDLAFDNFTIISSTHKHYSARAQKAVVSQRKLKNGQFPSLTAT
jgi:hypothetical protein